MHQAKPQAKEQETASKSSLEPRHTFLRNTLRRNHSSAMKTAVHASSIFCGALVVFLLLCSIAPLSKAQNRRPPVPHFYDLYPTRRANIKKALDATDSAIFFLGQARNEQVRHSIMPNSKITGREGIP